MLWGTVTQAGDHTHSVAVEASLLILRDPFQNAWTPPSLSASDNLTPASNQSPLQQSSNKGAGTTGPDAATLAGDAAKRLPASSWKAMSAMAGGTGGGGLPGGLSGGVVGGARRAAQVSRPTTPYQHQVQECQLCPLC